MASFANASGSESEGSELEPLPTRSIARFLFPLADIMALLFSLFLLLPHLERHPSGSTTPSTRPVPVEQQQRDRHELSRLRRLSRRPPSERIHLVILNIDADANLVVYQGRRPVILTPETLGKLIPEHREVARLAEKQLFYLVRLPRDGFALTIADERRFRRWLEEREVDYQIETP